MHNVKDFTEWYAIMAYTKMTQASWTGVTRGASKAREYIVKANDSYIHACVAHKLSSLLMSCP